MSGTQESVARAGAAGPHAPATAPCISPASGPVAVASSPAAAVVTANTVATAAAAALPLVQLLQQTLSSDPGVLRVTQEALDTKAVAEEFPKELLVLLVNADTPLPAKQAGAIYFKNFIRRSWDVDPQQGGISLANRTLIKQHLLSLLLAPDAPKVVQLQLAEACTRIAATDMPLDWPSLLPELMQQHLLPSLSTQQQLLQQFLQQKQCSGGSGGLVTQQEEAVEQQMQQQLQKEIAVLEMLHAVVKKYRTAFRSNDVLLELRQILPVAQQPLLQAFLLTLQHLQVLRSAAGATTGTAASGETTAGCTATSAATTVITLSQSLQQTKQLLYEVLLLCCKTFYSLNTVDIPEFFEDHMQDFFGGFIKLLQVDLLTETTSPQRQHQQHDEDDTADVEDRLRTQICINMKLYADKYQEEFQPFVMACVQAVWQMMTRIDRRQKFDFTAAAAMEFLSSAASTAWQTEGAPAGSAEAAAGDPFSNVQLLQEICEKTILPNVQLRDCDLEQMEDTPLEFARRELEGGEQHTRRSAALELVKSLMKLREELITALLLQAVQALSSQAAAKAATANREGGDAITQAAAGAAPAAAAVVVVDEGGSATGGTARGSPPSSTTSTTTTTTRSTGSAVKATADEEEEEKLLDACTFLVLAVGVKGSTRVRGVHAVNKNVDTQQFFQSLLLKELQNPNVDRRCIVRVAAMKVVAAFRNVFDIQLLQGVLPLLVMHLSAKRVVVHTFAAYAIERLLSARQNGQPRISTTFAAPLLKQALDVLFQQLQGCGHQSDSPGVASVTGTSGVDNEFLVKCVLRIFSFSKEDALAAVLPALRVILDNIKRICNNPSNPAFSHYLFECLATLVKLSSCHINRTETASAGVINYSTRSALEREVIPVLSVIVQQTVHEFVPYCFQILGLLLETAAAEEKGMPPATAALYVELYEHLLSPSFWTAAQGNVPALVKLLCCYFHRQQLFPDMIRNSMQQLLQRFQYCLYHKKLSAAAFELLNSIFRLLPFSYYSSFFRMLLTVLLRRVHELNKRLSICKEVALSFMLFQCKCEDPAVLVNTLEAIQAGLWQQVLSFILLPAITASAAASLHHKKVLILGLARVATCAAVANNKALLSPTLEALAALIARKEEDERDVHRTRASVKLAAAEEEENIAGYDPLTAAEFDLYYARLAAADIHHSKDMVEDVTDIQRSVQMCLSPLKADIEELARGGAQVRPLLAVLAV